VEIVKLRAFCLGSKIYRINGPKPFYRFKPFLGGKTNAYRQTETRTKQTGLFVLSKSNAYRGRKQNKADVLVCFPGIFHFVLQTRTLDLRKHPDCVLTKQTTSPTNFDDIRCSTTTCNPLDNHSLPVPTSQPCSELSL
jgi:hypothetical protein